MRRCPRCPGLAALPPSLLTRFFPPRPVSLPRLAPSQQGIDYCEVFQAMHIRHEQNQVGVAGWRCGLRHTYGTAVRVCAVDRGAGQALSWLGGWVGVHAIHHPLRRAPVCHCEQDHVAPGGEREGDGEARAAQEAELAARQRAAAAAEQRRRRERRSRARCARPAWPRLATAQLLAWCRPACCSAASPLLSPVPSAFVSTRLASLPTTSSTPLLSRPAATFLPCRRGAGGGCR